LRDDIHLAVDANTSSFLDIISCTYAKAYASYHLLHAPQAVVIPISFMAKIRYYDM
jgi:hypothetical protein